MLKYNLITTIVALITLTGCMQTNQSRGGIILPVNTENLNAKTIENDGIFAGIKILDEVPIGFKIEPRPGHHVKMYRALNYMGYDVVFLFCGSPNDDSGNSKDCVLGIRMHKYVGTPPYRGEVIAENNRFREKISGRTKVEPWVNWEFDKNGHSHWRVRSPEYYKSNPEDFKEGVAVSNYINGITLGWGDGIEVNNRKSYLMTIEVESPRLDILEKREKEEERAANVF